MNHTIWSNTNLNVEDGWIEAYKEFLEINDYEVPEEIDEDEVFQFMEDTNDEFLNDQRMNCNIHTDGEIIAIADVGLWNGRVTGYKLIGYNVKDCLYMMSSCDYGDFFVDRYDMRSVQHHHDGTHYIRYREFKPSISESQKNNFLGKIYDGTVTDKDITKYTRSLRPYVAKVYGW